MKYPQWFDRDFQPLPDMQTPPRTQAPVVCIRAPRCQTSEGEQDERRPPAIDWWGPDKRWNSPRLGGGKYIGYYKLPRHGWKDERNYPEHDRPVLCYVEKIIPGSWRAIPRGYYLGKCSFEEERRQWRVQIDWLILEAENREWLRRSNHSLLWVPLPNVPSLREADV